MPIDPGQMRTRLWYQVATKVDDGAGSSTDAWADSFARWARVRPARADETVQDGPQVQARVEWEVVCRYDPSIGPGGRFRFDGTDRAIDISSVVDWEMRGVELTCRAFETLKTSP